MLLSRMKVVNLLVGGPSDLWPTSFKNNEVSGDWIGVDRGNFWLINKGIDPRIAIGDFDSMNSEEFKLVSDHVKDIRRFNPVKDFTDTQLALRIASEELNADVINIFGATGGRLDHFMSNILMATEPKFKSIVEKIRIVDVQNTIQYFLPGLKKVVKKESDKKYLAFIPLNKMKLSIWNAKYTLDNHEVPRPFAYSSNEFIGEEANFSFDKGIVCVIQSKDK